MEKSITFRVNGASQTIATDPERSLLEVLREELHLTGTKFGCGEGQCLACTVLVNNKPIASCITPVSSVEGQTLVTIEGVGNGSGLHPVQQAFLAERAFQCGYCTSGMILGAVGLLSSNPRPTEDDVRAGMQRHICRCGTYPRIIKAIRRAAELAAK